MCHAKILSKKIDTVTGNDDNNAHYVNEFSSGPSNDASKSIKQINDDINKEMEALSEVVSNIANN